MNIALLNMVMELPIINKSQWLSYIQLNQNILQLVVSMNIIARLFSTTYELKGKM